MCDSRETLVGSLYDGCMIFEDKTVTSWCDYVFQMYNLTFCSRDKIKGVI